MPESGGHVHRIVGDGVGKYRVAGSLERVQQVIPRLTGLEIRAGRITGGSRLAHRERQPGRVLERTHDRRGDGGAANIDVLSHPDWHPIREGDAVTIPPAWGSDLDGGRKSPGTGKAHDVLSL